VSPGRESREILLSKEERAHVRSRRLRDGGEIVVLDGRGLRARATLARGGTAVHLLSFEERRGAGEPRVAVTVALACSEPARVEWAIEKGTECGGAGFVLLAAERSQKAHVAALSTPTRLERLRRIAVEAVKQCDRSVVPGVEAPESTEDFLRRVREAEGASFLVAHPGGAPLEEAAGARPPRRPSALSERSEFVRGGAGASSPRPPVVILAIGPEGGFSPREISLFEAASGVLVSLGPRILRLETAVVAALTRLVDPD
jgi:16S rRNA (uracil1498-N3)-methyltransferase